MGRQALSTALLIALILAAAALASRLMADAGAGGVGGARPISDSLPLLFAAAGLCVAGLLRQRAPAGAWLATVSVGAIAAIVILGAVRARLAVEDATLWPALVLGGQAALLAAAGIAGAYAARSQDGREGHTRDGRAHEDGRGRREAAWRVGVLLALVVVAGSGGWALAEVAAEPRLAPPPPPGLPAFRISTRLASAFIAVMALAGVWRDLRTPLARARTRSGSLRELPRTIAEELLPNATAARRRGRDEERARIAADLHALVLPDLRRAARAAEDAAGSTDIARARPVAADLRQAVEGVERLMHQRQSIVLEEYGLVAGLEWLAERTQQRGALEVDIELDGADVGNPGAVSPPVARAAFRVALLALDNVVRHAGASRALIRLDVDGGRGRLAVVDDGHGIEAAPAPRAGRGLIDMRTAASEIGASVTVERRDGSTAVEMTWASAPVTAEDPATVSADLTARPSTPPARP